MATYKVLYRKYRPDQFNKIVGQEYSIQMLKNAILHNKISHAYLFTGPRGTGKTSTAKVFAKTINCLNPIDGEACGNCSSCLSFEQSADIIEIDAASNNGVDDIRELINNVKIAPSEGKYKIYIIDEVHMMTTSAFNALLLTLEEPPKHAIFIMATTNVENVPITILSRCQRFNFQKISLENLQKQISFVCAEENIDITEDAILEIAYLSEGGLRDALSLLDQLSSNGEKITVDKILANYGSISNQFIKNLIKHVENKEVEEVNKLMNELMMTSSDYKIFIKKMIQEFSHIAIQIKTNSYNSKLSFNEIKQLVFEFNDILNKTNINVNPYLLILMTLLSAMKTEKTLEIPHEIPKVEVFVSQENQNKPEEIESKADENENNQAIYNYNQKLKKIRINNCFVDAQKKILLENQAIWEQIKNEIDLNPEIASFIFDSSLVVSSENYALICSKMESVANLINNKLEEIDILLQKYFKNPIHFVALSQKEWDIEKQEYVNKLKNKYSYQLIDEKSILETKPKFESEIESIASKVFNHDKIELV